MTWLIFFLFIIFWLIFYGLEVRLKGWNLMLFWQNVKIVDNFLVKDFQSLNHALPHALQILFKIFYTAIKMHPNRFNRRRS